MPQKKNAKKEINKTGLEEIRNKNIFDLTKQEFFTYFEKVIRPQTTKFVQFMAKVDSLVFAKGKGAISVVGSSFIIQIFLWATIITADFWPFPEVIQQKLFYLSSTYPKAWPIISFVLVLIIFWGIFIGLVVFIGFNLTKIFFDKPAKKTIFKAMGMEYHTGLFYSDDFKEIAKQFSKIFFRVDEMVNTTYKGQKLVILDCVEKGATHKIFLATKTERKFASQTLIKTKGSFDSPFFEGSKVNLEDIKFSKVYNVFSDDQVEARYILTPTFMERLLKYNPQKAGNVQVFFSDKLSQDYNVFFYIPVNKNWFEFPSEIALCRYIRPSWFYNFFKDIKEIMQVVEALKLDQDIGM